MVVEVFFWDSLLKQIAVLTVGSNTIKLLPPPLKLVAPGGFFILMFHYFHPGAGFFPYRPQRGLTERDLPHIKPTLKPMRWKITCYPFFGEDDVSCL